MILTFLSEHEDGEDSVDSGGLLASLISVRAELARGDLRALYLGWLLCMQNGELDVDTLAPPVPAGLTKLSASLTSLVEFLRVDKALVRASAKAAANVTQSKERLGRGVAQRFAKPRRARRR